MGLDVVVKKDWNQCLHIKINSFVFLSNCPDQLPTQQKLGSITNHRIKNTEK